jgi:carboxyl-terminal processing protease
MKSLESLKAKGLKSLVLDLRDNGGGILEEAVDIADEFIGNNNLIVYTEGKNSPKKEYICKRPGLFEEGELVVLMNEGSASASEVLAGALQDLDRAVIVGRRSFGKGLVQEQYTLSDGSALRLTVAKYYTPLGRSIQRSYKNGNQAYQNEVLKRFHNEEGQKTDTSTANHAKKFKTASGKLLYGGGGITPDVFVAIDTTYFDTSINKFYVKNTIGNFSYNFFMDNKGTFKQYKTTDDFVRNFSLPENILDQLDQFAKRDSIVASPTNTASKQYLKTRIKALIARILWDENGYYQVVNGDDETFRRAVRKG